MFPLDFPLRILQRMAVRGDTVLDPFCGRGTTNLAARIVGIESLGVDSSKVAVAITAAKLVAVDVADIVNEARCMLADRKARHVPVGEFWDWAFHASVLDGLCRLREALLEDCSAATRVALRGIVLGALHGPKQKTFPGYLSNQSPRTYAPKPSYATRYWQSRQLVPEPVDIMAVIERRAVRYYGTPTACAGVARLGDSRNPVALEPPSPGTRFRWVITSPPYYGMRTYVADQWLRNWFVGGPDHVDYTCREQVAHSSPAIFASELRQVWLNAAAVCTSDAHLVVRFGGIPDRRVDPLDLIERSLSDSGWRIAGVRDAGTATEGKRQADSFLRTRSKPVVEYDVWAVRC
ncbi:MAG: site-specific DNA-methyltransferase [Chthonomonadales bacterium]|nr:site-specific DNA-methyltransferase [Chthonomonadales bacterium]